MDPGHFLTNSGSKIPMPKSRKDVAVVQPMKPKLAFSKIDSTNFNPEVSEDNDLPRGNQGLQKSQPVTNLKTAPSRSVPNIAKPAAALVRSRTNAAIRNGPSAAGKSGPSNATAVKRAAAPSEPAEAPVNKQAKAAPKTGFPYKAKNWELKLRLAECEEWVTDLRAKNSALETQYNSNLNEIEEMRNFKEEAEREKAEMQKRFDSDIEKARSEIDKLTKEKASVEEDLRLRTESYNKLYDDSKQFINKIEKLEETLAQRDNQINVLQTDQNRLREDVLSRDATISQLRFTVDDLEFKTRRQKNQIDDLENTVTQIRKENSELQSRLRDRDDLITVLQDKLDKAERDNKFKASNLSDLEGDLLKARSKILSLENEVSELRAENGSLKHNLKNAKDEISERKATGESLATTCEELKTKLCESEKLRRYLHNTVQDLKGNIRVFCRVRPPIQSEKENAAPLCSVNFPDEGSLEISKSDPFSNGGNNTNSSATSRPKFVKHEFSFDRVFNPSASQQDVFDELSQLVQSALDGYNVCVFAYGQTGSGKTYTMEGQNDPATRGMIPRTVDHIFKTRKELEMIGWEYTVEVSFLEIYNEIIRDLLRNDKEGSSLKIMQVDGKTNDVTIPGLTVMKVDSYEDLDRLYLLAHQNRAVAYTSCNERSSRSHSVTRIKVTGVHKERGERCYGSLYLVDLAGSERLNEPMSDPRFREMKNINKSLSELGNVILGLLQKQEYIPYRNSKLTHLLQPALGGSSKTLMMVNISPAENCLQETLCSLRFAEKVNRVKMGTTKKRIAYDNSALGK